MAENRSVKQTSDTATAAGEPLLRKGRSADPAPASTGEEAKSPARAATGVDSGRALNSRDRTAALEAEAGSNNEKEPPEAEQAAPEEEDEDSIERTMAESRQRRLRLMLRQCDRVLLMDFNLLAMSRWPDNFTLAGARRQRDLWVFSVLVAAAVFLSGLTGFVPAWIAGGGFGACVIILLLGLPAIRPMYTSSPSYLDLILRRQRMLSDARKHIEHLEGKEGLAWQCARMAEFNPTLRSTRFSELRSLSEHRVLARNLRRRDHIRLYLIYLLEAEKAYKAVQNAFFEGHQQAIDRGWSSVAATPEGKA